MGSGGVFAEEDHYYLVLTNGHVVAEAEKITLEFYSEGYKSIQVPAEKERVFYRKGTSIDLAILKVQKGSLGGYTPKVINLAPRDYEVSKNDEIFGFGCPTGGWSQGWHGRIINLHDNTFDINMPPRTGQSGSSVVKFINGEPRVIGMVTWRIGESYKEEYGGVISHQRLIDILYGIKEPDTIPTTHSLPAFFSADVKCKSCGVTSKYHSLSPSGLQVCPPACEDHKKYLNEHTEAELASCPRCFPFCNPFHIHQTQPTKPSPKIDNPFLGVDEDLEKPFWEHKKDPNPKQEEAPAVPGPPVIRDNPELVEKINDLLEEKKALLEKIAQLSALPEKLKTAEEKSATLQSLLDKAKEASGISMKVFEDKFGLEKSQLLERITKLTSTNEGLAKAKEELEGKLGNFSLADSKVKDLTGQLLDRDKKIDELSQDNLYETTSFTAAGIAAGIVGPILIRKLGPVAGNIALRIGGVLVQKGVGEAKQAIRRRRRRKKGPWDNTSEGDEPDEDVVYDDENFDVNKYIPPLKKPEQKENPLDFLNKVIPVPSPPAPNPSPPPFNFDKFAEVPKYFVELFENKKKDGEKVENWAVFGVLYKEAVDLLRQGKLPNVNPKDGTLLGQQNAAFALDNWVRDEFMNRVTKEDINQHLYCHAVLGFLYKEAVELLRRGELDVLNHETIADSVHRFVRDSFLKRKNII